MEKYFQDLQATDGEEKKQGEDQINEDQAAQSISIDSDNEAENESVEEFRICWQSPRFVKARVSAILFYPFAVLIICLLSQF